MGFDLCSEFSLSDGSVGKNVVIFRADMSSSTFTAEAKYTINFTQSGKRFVLSLHYNGSNSYKYINSKQVKDSEIKYFAPCLGDVSKDFTINNMKKTRLKGVVKYFSVDFNSINTYGILDIHKYFMKRIWYKIMFGLIKKMFTGLLPSLVHGSNQTKCVSLSNQKLKIQTTLINFH